MHKAKEKLKINSFIRSGEQFLKFEFMEKQVNILKVLFSKKNKIIPQMSIFGGKNQFLYCPWTNPRGKHFFVLISTNSHNVP